MQFLTASVVLFGATLVAWAEGPAIAGPSAQEAVIRIHAKRPSAHPIPKYITGKFCEHLGANIYQGMDAQILCNPTFAEYPFGGREGPDGGAAFLADPKEIASRLRKQAAQAGWPETELDRLVEAREDALACWWIRAGGRKTVETSPDIGPCSGRAQRIAISRAGEGIAQWVFLPLHRTRRYEVEILARSPDPLTLSVALFAGDAKEPAAKAVLPGVTGQSRTLRCTLTVDAQSPAEAAYCFVLTGDTAGQLVIARAMLRPADHVGGADPDVVRMLKESRLPLLRWPGGNFVSGYHWADGVGPLDARPTRPNFAWGGVEPNLFGTDEFMAFCQAVGCEPMICVNAGTGTPEEAARWIEYCNGPADSPMGKLRAANGHPAPYGVRHGEVGNELWGRWQIGWTTAAGYADRWCQFRHAMLAADPSIKLYAYAAPVFSDKQWNRTLLGMVSSSLGTLTDHPLIGGSVPASADPLDIYRDFMAIPDVLAGKWSALEGQMHAAGIHDPRLAVTELQMFAHLAPAAGQKVRLTKDNLVSPGTQAEALYDVLIYHRAIRMAPFVEMITHSATVNHGGGLRKERQRVYANPCHWAQAGFAEFAGARPVAVDVQSPKEKAPLVMPALKGAVGECSYDAIDALAAVTDGGDLLLSVVHRGSSGPVRIAVAVDDFVAGPKAEVYCLAAGAAWAANTLESPKAIEPQHSHREVRDGKLLLDAQPFTWLRVRIPRARGPRPGE